MLATESFFKAGGTPAKEMEGGNGASAASGITQFAEGEPKRWNYDTVSVYQPLKGGNGVSEANVVTLCSKCEIPYYAAENLLWM
ncbi:MAG: hypothetical protein IJH67_13040 [Thermoguttaceae bacterium]|nr:hypothetical protein [Thermoguttaceae bacterium]